MLIKINNYIIIRVEINYYQLLNYMMLAVLPVTGSGSGRTTDTTVH